MKCPNCSIELSIIATGAKNESSETAGLGELLAKIHDDELETEFEIEFIKQTRERFAQYADRTRMSERQMACLRKIAAK